MSYTLKKLNQRELIEIDGGGFIGFCLGYCFGTIIGVIGAVPVAIYGCVTKAEPEETVKSSLVIVVTSAAVFSAIGAAVPGI